MATRCHSPSDDQDPVPVTFLTVAAGVRFVFPLRVRPQGSEAAREAGAGELLQVARRWLVHGLTLEGAGGKTAAGYGYFEVEASEEGGLQR